MKRERGNGGFFQRIGLLLAALVILTLTFTLGVLVGRQWGGRGPPRRSRKAPGSRAALTRRALGEAETERPREIGEKLTFYQTLTAPLGPTGSSARARGGRRARAPRRPRRALPPAAPTPPSPPRLPRTASRPRRLAARATPPPPRPRPRAGACRWARSAAASRPTASIGAHGGGLPAVLSNAVALDDGQPRYRVRVGGARSRDEAEQLAQRVRARVPVATCVTAN